MNAFWKGVASIMDIFGTQSQKRQPGSQSDYEALKGDWEKVVGPQMDVPRRGPSWSTKPDTENPTRPEVKPRYEMTTNRLTSLTVDPDGSVDFYFEGSCDPFTYAEFHGPTRMFLLNIESAIRALNFGNEGEEDG